MPAISVILPVYNGANYLAEAIESVLRQTFTDFDLHVLDAGHAEVVGDVDGRSENAAR